MITQKTIPSSTWQWVQGILIHRLWRPQIGEMKVIYHIFQWKWPFYERFVGGFYSAHSWNKAGQSTKSVK